MAVVGAASRNSTLRGYVSALLGHCSARLARRHAFHDVTLAIHAVGSTRVSNSQLADGRAPSPRPSPTKWRAVGSTKTPDYDVADAFVTLCPATPDAENGCRPVHALDPTWPERLVKEWEGAIWVPTITTSAPA